MTVDPAEDDQFMRLALREARRALERGGGEVGCVIVRDGVVLARGYNEAELRHDPTAHAEIVALRKLGATLKTIDFRGCTLYSTLQPCGMCTLAAVWANVSRIVYGAGQREVAGEYSDERHLHTIDFVRDSFQQSMQVTGGVLAAECAELYRKPAR